MCKLEDGYVSKSKVSEAEIVAKKLSKWKTTMEISKILSRLFTIIFVVLGVVAFLLSVKAIKLTNADYLPVISFIFIVLFIVSAFICLYSDYKCNIVISPFIEEAESKKKEYEEEIKKMKSENDSLLIEYSFQLSVISAQNRITYILGREYLGKKLKEFKNLIWDYNTSHFLDEIEKAIGKIRFTNSEIKAIRETLDLILKESVEEIEKNKTKESDEK